jgi:hypothetical protein
VLCCTGLADSGIVPPMKYWEIIADKLSGAGWSWAIAVLLRPMVGVGSLTLIAEMVAATLSNLTNC